MPKKEFYTLIKNIALTMKLIHKYNQPRDHLSLEHYISINELQMPRSTFISWKEFVIKTD